MGSTHARASAHTHTHTHTSHFIKFTFGQIILGKIIKPAYPPFTVLIERLLFFCTDDFGFKQPTKVNMPLNKEKNEAHTHTYICVGEFFGWLVGFYGISTFAVYLMPIPANIYIYIYVCVCVCVWLGCNCSFKHVSINNKDTFCLLNLFKIISSFLISVLVSGWNW